MTFEHYYIDIPIPRLFLGARHYGRGCLDVAVLIWWAFIKGGPSRMRTVAHPGPRRHHLLTHIRNEHCGG
jgi:hypothetical protein